MIMHDCDLVQHLLKKGILRRCKMCYSTFVVLKGAIHRKPCPTADEEIPAPPGMYKTL